MREFAVSFYKSQAWKQCRAAFVKSKGGLCERCYSRGEYKAGVIVHHKIHLTPENIKDPDVCLNWNNLELLCRDCHGAEHGKIQRRYTVDEWGRVSV